MLCDWQQECLKLKMATVDAQRAREVIERKRDSSYSSDYDTRLLIWTSRAPPLLSPVSLWRWTSRYPSRSRSRRIHAHAASESGPISSSLILKLGRGISVAQIDGTCGEVERCCS